MAAVVVRRVLARARARAGRTVAVDPAAEARSHLWQHLLCRHARAERHSHHIAHRRRAHRRSDAASRRPTSPRTSRALGVRLADVKLIVNSHAHIDHAGGIAELQRRTGATVAALPWSAEALRSGKKHRGDPQFDTPMSPPERVAKVKTIQDGEVLTRWRREDHGAQDRRPYARRHVMDVAFV